MSPNPIFFRVSFRLFVRTPRGHRRRGGLPDWARSPAQSGNQQLGVQPWQPRCTLQPGRPGRPGRPPGAPDDRPTRCMQIPAGASRDRGSLSPQSQRCVYRWYVLLPKPIVIITIFIDGCIPVTARPDTRSPKNPL